MKIVVPSIDILNGKAVRLTQGRQGSERVFGEPVSLAARYDSAGFGVVHVVDLDAAFGGENQFGVLMAMRRACKRMRIQWAGGIRSRRSAAEAFGHGCDEVVFGTSIFKAREEVIAAVKEFGKERVWGSLDFSGKPPMAMIRGWKDGSGVGAPDAVSAAWGCGVGGVIIGSVDADGMASGPALGLLFQGAIGTGKPVWIAGGIRGAEDARNAFGLGASGVIFGSALYKADTDLRDLLCLQEE
ncbi:MAG: HisA/HisF-related TIM barrel protein [Candidatus Marsarchaeota archaeon]|jgi:phosphoribosylformimino-5-aminoimidazole carboxamide ribonucleotide (ProFAR) isomerase|nr:HisA/HisF-related TIM barrel protein [Candidatus Marsarchaeota archaeon]